MTAPRHVASQNIRASRMLQHHIGLEVMPPRRLGTGPQY